MTEKWTSGPWSVAGKQTIKAGRDRWIGKTNWNNGQANARLIAAAPEMYEALEPLAAIADAYDGMDPAGGIASVCVNGDWIKITISDARAARAAMRKARGEDV